VTQIFKAALVALLVVFALPPAARAVEYGTRDEARAMAERAAQFFVEQGKDKAFAAFNDGTDGFKDRDLYVFVYDNAGICAAHGANKAMVGKSLIDLRDVDGKDIVRAIVAVQTSGWVEYKWPNPQTKAITGKAAYVVRSGPYLFGVGAYTTP